MEAIATIFAAPLGRVLYYAFLVTGSFGLSIILFSVIAKLLLFPLTRMAHLNSIKLLRLQPAIYAIKKRYGQDKERLNEEQYELFVAERYSPLIGIVPLLAQLLLLMGMLQVMYDPLRHMRLPEYTDLSFLGMNLGVVPSLRYPSVELAMPFVSGLAALVFSLVQNFISPGALSQGKKTNLGLIIFTVCLSVYFAAVTPAGVGLYWTVGNLFAIVLVVVLYLWYNPHKLAGEALAHLKSSRKSSAILKAEREVNKALKIREKADVSRFLTAKKLIVFYAITGGQYKYYKTVIDYILENSDIVIHYLTNDANDNVFNMDKERLVPYYAGQGKTISLMLKLEAKMLVTTVPDLQTMHMKRSIAASVEYVYIFHAPIGSVVQYRERAFDYFDTIFCVGPHHVAEQRRREEIAGIKKRNLVKAGYGMYDLLVESVKAVPLTKGEKKRILIAPSWQKDNLFETCINEILEVLLNKGHEIIARPHPQFMQLFPEKMDALIERYKDSINSGELIFELDFSGNESIFSSDLLLTDWSGIAYEFSYCTSKPCVFINTTQKITNPNYERYGIIPMEMDVRDKVGVSVDPDDIKEKLGSVVEELLENSEKFKKQIEETLGEYLFYPNRSGEAGGKYIINKLWTR